MSGNRPSFRLVITGGSCSGKTRLLTELRTRVRLRTIVVAEVATDLITAQGVDQRHLRAAERRDLQLQIYREQIRREAGLPAHESLIALDRGTVDGAAYWPEGPDGFWTAVGSTLDRELDRYDAAVWLEPLAALGPMTVASNPTRTDTASETLREGRILYDLWQRHPQFFAIRAYPNFAEKKQRFDATVQRLLGDEYPIDTGGD